jgi:chemotaxis regulatin CheY-phosphate phosphatase CheZ
MSQQEKIFSETQRVVGAKETWRQGLTALEESIQGFLESLREIKAPLTDSKDVLPKATSQLDRITAQTEKATHKVLDIADTIATAQNEIISTLNEAINMLNDGNCDPKAVIEKIESSEEFANRTLNDTYTIMDALQFQDITTQQIDHAASLLEEVEGKITGIIGEMLPGDDDAGDSSTSEKRVRAFDPHADMEFKHTDQTGVDDIVSSANKSKPNK